MAYRSVVMLGGTGFIVGHVDELAGARAHTLRELVTLAGACTGHPRPVIGLPESIAS
jgi:hypothetical protein